MRWLADECVEAGLVARLRAKGHDVVYAAEEAAGATDVEVTERAGAEERLLLTVDKDFGDLVFRGARQLPGVVLLRLAPERHAFREERLLAAIERLGERLFGRYTVVEAGRLRSRPLPPRGASEA